MESVKESRPNVGLKSSDTERNLIGHRTQSDQTPNAIRSDGGRNPIRRRTQSDQTADANGNYSLHFAPLCQPSSTKKATNN